MKHMKSESVDDESTDIWCDNTIQKYEKRPVELEEVTLAQFFSSWFVNTNDEWKRRKDSKVIRYIGE